MSQLIFIILSVVFAGILLITKDLPLVSGCALASGAGERISMKILTPVVFVSAVVLCSLSPSWADKTIAIDKPLAAGIATLLTVVITLIISRFPAIPLAFAGAVAGVSQAEGTSPIWGSVSGSIISWLVAPLLCALLAAGIYRVYMRTAGSSNSHLILRESRLVKYSAVASLLLIVAFAFNNAPLFAYFPVSQYGSGWTAAGIAAGSGLLAYLLVFNRTNQSKFSIADSDLDINSESTFSAILAMAVVFWLFSWNALDKAGLASTPLPASTLFVAALTGISIVRGRALIEGVEIQRCIIAAILSPVLGAATGYSLGHILGGDPANMLIGLGLIALAAAIVFYLRWQSRMKIRKQIIQSREEQIYNTRKSLMALEVKAEMTEKELTGKLDRKRQELVDFAVGISDQKKFMEEIYERLREIRKMQDGPEKDSRLDSLLSSIRERMYFSREMNDFYARSEVLHKDFNMRLLEAYPNLTENERKLANLLRQGFSSKNIASLMNITPKSVEINRYRLRAKLGLQRKDNLIQFIKSI